MLKKLQSLDLWGSQISNEGSAILNMFPKLSHLNLAMTGVTRLPNLLSLECLNMSYCTIISLRIYVPILPFSFYIFLFDDFLVKIISFFSPYGIFLDVPCFETGGYSSKLATEG